MVQLKSEFVCFLARWFTLLSIQLNDLNNQVSRDANRLKESQSELTEYRNNLSSLTAQIEALRSNKDYLERQLADVEDRLVLKWHVSCVNQHFFPPDTSAKSRPTRNKSRQ